MFETFDSIPCPWRLTAIECRGELGVFHAAGRGSRKGGSPQKGAGANKGAGIKRSAPSSVRASGQGTKKAAASRTRERAKKTAKSRGAK